jgi:hypothetical protein
MSITEALKNLKQDAQEGVDYAYLSAVSAHWTDRVD